MATITHKRGDTFELSCTLENEGSSVDITNFTITSQIRQSDDTLLQALTVAKTDAANGAFTLSATAAETETWAAANYECDIEFVDGGGEVNSSQTFTISVLKDITRD
jgi:hypothetical protein